MTFPEGLVNSTIDYKYEIGVLIPHYNNISGLIKSLRSVECKKSTFVLVVDDGSKPDFIPELHLLKEHCAYHIDLIFLEKNKGIETALNTGLKYLKENVTPKYIARIDCGDVMISSRLEKQYNFFEENSEIYLLGSWVKFYHKNEHQFTLELPQEHDQIIQRMMYQVSIIHPTVMFRSILIELIGFYPLKYPAAEDFAYFMRIIEKYKCANIPEVLTLVENNPKGISISKRNRQIRSKIKVIWEFKRLSVYSIFGLVKLCAMLLLPINWVQYFKMKYYK